jgi:DNA modification methylase
LNNKRHNEKKRMLPDIKPVTPTTRLVRGEYQSCGRNYDINHVAAVVGLSTTFVQRYLGVKTLSISGDQVLELLDSDAFSETFVPRSRILEYLDQGHAKKAAVTTDFKDALLLSGSVPEILSMIPEGSVTCVVTSSPYWGTRIYENSTEIIWADGERCAYGHEQTPEGFIRHSVQVLYQLKSVLTTDGSVWWNIMDTYNTRTQIRSNAAEALRAMQGNDRRSWSEHECRRYSAGHAYLKDGEACQIPARIAERASRIGYLLKSSITWAKTSCMPEPQQSRVSRASEMILHLSLHRTPKFRKDAYLTLPPQLGGRNDEVEVGKVSDVWMLPTSSGRDGHGAQFPLSLPARCIAVSTDLNDLVLDPFVGSGNSGVAALSLGRRFIGIDVSEKYLQVARQRLNGSQIPLSGL